MMDHAEAVRRLAAEQYLLGELTEAEREEFEQHFFACSDCAEMVESGTALLVNAKAVLAERGAAAPVAAEHGSFWQQWRFVPMAAVAGWVTAAALAGYLVLRPSGSAALTIAPAVAVRAVRAADDLHFSRQAGSIALAVAPEWEQKFAGYVAQIEGAADHRVKLEGNMTGAPEGSPLSITIRPASLHAGTYFLVLYGLRGGGPNAERIPVERIRFSITD